MQQTAGVPITTTTQVAPVELSGQSKLLLAAALVVGVALIAAVGHKTKMFWRARLQKREEQRLEYARKMGWVRTAR